MVLSELSECSEKVIVPNPQGAFYVFVKLKQNCDELELVRKLIYDYKVAVMPGNTFGTTDASYLRIAFGALDKETVAKAMSRLKEGLNSILD